jgi:hypothetical protein
MNTDMQSPENQGNLRSAVFRVADGAISRCGYSPISGISGLSRIARAVRPTGSR